MTSHAPPDPHVQGAGEVALGGDVLGEALGGLVTSSSSEAVVSDQVVTPYYRDPMLTVAKRFMDIFLALITLMLLMPMLVVVAVAILITDGRPIFYPWDVVGYGGQPFRGWKFRTMVRNADALRASLAEHNQMQGPVFKMRNDPRVTRVGTILRRYSLDELPQLWSVLKGDMSLVGPRPLGPAEFEAATHHQRQKLGVIPGITCLWQVMGRSQICDFDEWVSLDLQYIETWSLLLDLKILLRTIPAVLLRKGAW